MIELTYRRKTLLQLQPSPRGLGFKPGQIPDGYALAGVKDGMATVLSPVMTKHFESHEEIERFLERGTTAMTILVDLFREECSTVASDLG